jgi:hypothetical protein
MDRYYHATSKKNFESIKKEMILKCDSRKLVYACRDLDSTIEFAKKMIGNGRMNYDELVIFEFTTESEFIESFDHGKKFHNNAKAYKTIGDVLLNSIEEVEVIFDWKGYLDERFINEAYVSDITNEDLLRFSDV